MMDLDLDFMDDWQISPVALIIAVVIMLVMAISMFKNAGMESIPVVYRVIAVIACTIGAYFMSVKILSK